MEKPDIINLIENAKAGCQKSYSALYSRYFPQVRAYCASLLRKNWNDVAVQDFTAIVMAKVLCKLALYSDKFPIIVWIKAIAINERRDALRKLQTQTHHFVDIDNCRRAYNLSDNYQADSNLNVQDYKNKINQFITGQNSPLHGKIMHLFFNENLSYKSIQEKTGVCPATISSLLSRSRKKLFGRMEK